MTNRKASTPRTRKAATRTTSEVSSQLRGAECALCRKAAKEIRRLTKVIDDYVYIVKASAKEIRQLRER